MSQKKNEKRTPNLDLPRHPGEILIFVSYFVWELRSSLILTMKNKQTFMTEETSWQLLKRFFWVAEILSWQRGQHWHFRVLWKEVWVTYKKAPQVREPIPESNWVPTRWCIQSKGGHNLISLVQPVWIFGFTDCEQHFRWTRTSKFSTLLPQFGVGWQLCFFLFFFFFVRMA